MIVSAQSTRSAPSQHFVATQPSASARLGDGAFVMGL
jgi:hypothetical protein